MERVIFHVDVNSAFLSWTAAYRCLVLGERQDLREIPSAVCGDRAERHGIILAKSLPAKARGVRTGEPLFRARQKCPEPPGSLWRCCGRCRRRWSSTPSTRHGPT